MKTQREKLEELESVKESVKHEIHNTQPSGLKLLKNYYPHDACDQIDDIFKIIESSLASQEGEETYFKLARGKASEEIKTPNCTIETGDIVEGYLNSYHLMDCYSVQVELTQDCGNTPGCSGIVVVNVPIEKNSLVYIDGEQIFRQTPPTEGKKEVKCEHKEQRRIDLYYRYECKDCGELLP